MERGRRGDVDHRAKWLYKEKKKYLKKKTEGEENALVVKKWTSIPDEHLES